MQRRGTLSSAENRDSYTAQFMYKHQQTHQQQLQAPGTGIQRPGFASGIPQAGFNQQQSSGIPAPRQYGSQAALGQPSHTMSVTGRPSVVPNLQGGARMSMAPQGNNTGYVGGSMAAVAATPMHHAGIGLRPPESRVSFAPSAFQQQQTMHGYPAQDAQMGGRQSIAPPGTAVTRRTTAMFNGRPSMAPVGSTAAMGLQLAAPSKDPRSVRSSQGEFIRNIQEYLSATHYPGALSQAALKQGTGKDFQGIFRFLYSKFDAHYQWQKKFEEEVPQLLKALKYPYADTISKTQLYSIGNAHSWPNLLAMLDWMVNMLKTLELTDANAINSVDGVAFEFYAFHEYVAASYDCFMSLREEPAELLPTLRYKCEQQYSEIAKDLAYLKEECEVYSHKLEALDEDKNPLADVEKDVTVLMRDVHKFTEYMGQLNVKKDKLVQVIENCEQSAVNEIKSHGELELLCDKLKGVIDKQEVSPADIARMNVDQDNLIQSLRIVQGQSDRHAKESYETEIKIQKTRDHLESHVKAYHNAACQLKLVSDNTANANGVDFDLRLNMAASRAEDMPSVDLPGIIQPALQQLGARFHNEYLQLEEELQRRSEELEQVKDLLSDTDSKFQVLNTQQSLLKERYMAEKEALHKHEAEQTRSLESYENKISRLRSEPAHAVIAAEERAKLTEAECMRAHAESRERQRQGMDEVVALIHYLVDARSHIETSLGIFMDEVTHEELGTKQLLNSNGGSIDADASRAKLAPSGRLFPNA